MTRPGDDAFAEAKKIRIGFDPDDPRNFTRPWFAWATSLVGELLERAALDGLLD